MDDDEFRALARQHAHLALKFLANAVADPNTGARDREHARRDIELRLKHLGDDISPDLRRELENAVHGK
jgi:hypothetical protein